MLVALKSPRFVHDFEKKYLPGNREDRVYEILREDLSVVWGSVS